MSARLLLTIAVDILLLFGVMVLMRHVKYLLLEDVRLNLTEVASQATEVVDSHLGLEIHILSLLARNLVDENAALRANPDGRVRCEDWQKPLANLVGQEQGRYFIADMDGRAFVPGHPVVDVKGRKYYRKAITDGPCFSTRLILRHNGEHGIVLSVPMVYKDRIVGTLQKIYTPSMFYTMAVPSIFSSRGVINIIAPNGYLLVSSQDKGKTGDFDNLFRDLYESGNRDAATRMEKDLAQFNAGFVETVEDGKPCFAVYMPIDAVAGWSLVFSVAQQTVFQHATRVMNIFYGVLLVLVIIFAVSVGMFVRMKRRERQHLEEIAFVDSVTGGNTYSKFTLVLQERLATMKDEQYSILSFDIDSFKYINSHYGFDVGDDILRLVDRSATSRLADGEVLGHVSGDRFVALLRNTTKDHVLELLTPMDTPHGVTLHFSGGLYHVKDAEESTKLIVDKATLAGKEVKGKFHEFYAEYSDELDRRLLLTEQMKQDLQEALAKGEIIPFFQPKIDIDTGRLVGAEALARWRKPDGSLVPPGDFIPISETTGLVMEIDKAILAYVLRFIRKHLDNGVDSAPISSNFSRMHLLDVKFPQNIISMLEEHGIPPRYLEVELTESTFYSTHKSIAELVMTLRNGGVRVSMDDFGSGYSSLNMLKDIPINVLKIDQVFLQQTNNVARRDIIFAAVVKMAQELDIDVVVEGVETAEDVELMRRFSCHVAQGYYYSRPLSPEDFAIVYQQGHL